MYSDYSMPAPNGVDFGSEYRDLFIYHPGTGTMIPLSDLVYLVDSAWCSEAMLEEYSMGSNEASRHSQQYGYRLDNYNMTNLFFGEE
jgi:hypothetical protein